MTKDIHYYSFDEDGNPQAMTSSKEAYIDDDELKDLLLDLLDDNVSKSDIDEILKAASDKNISEEEFDKLIDKFILKNKQEKS